MHLIDTNIAIYLRDGHGEMTTRLIALSQRPAISLMTWVEMEGGVHTHPRFAAYRRAATDALVAAVDILPLDPPVVAAYTNIVGACGFSRPRILDRLIAATAIIHSLTLVTINGDDFRNIPGLSLDIWPAPAQ
ncbi:hypothetical protein ASG67_07270 [Sphingomonas sp. Leaf339]|uniref:PIN domain-containing protein n=1 Tax=Sphingomonas sp. Leaf339 TaxID=1736343 RepID=UPI0006FF7D12|nr:PIN domain-containing protein [Sphingomonas sp. Leaf339]KQU55896.1 hypothetical protein ASG67_07270 [Sphingomonas sp. Leaf339]